jgi:GGDEF domain-containing protein
LRAAFEATTHPLADGPLSATASVGVAISDDASSDLAALLDVADQALYRSKAMAADLVFDGPGRWEAAGSTVGIPGSTWIGIVSG